MANIAAIRIENARLAEVEQAERIMARDLSQAADIQGRMLPEKAPDVPGADLAGFNMACRTVGGDYYDFFTYPDGRVALALGDVSGKGMPASLMMMALQARVHVLAEEPGNLAHFMTRINKATCATCPSNRFITSSTPSSTPHRRTRLRQRRPQSAHRGARQRRRRNAGGRRPSLAFSPSPPTVRCTPS
jgi:sigma-B regulation protein RsbU (phosphoserine phosphatase)